MRLVQVAKILGMTGQQLRHELSQVNFGVKPTDREIPDGVAKGVIRFIATKNGLKINFDDLGATLGDDVEEEEGEEEGSQDASAPETAAPSAPQAAPSAPAAPVKNYMIPNVPTVSQAAAQRKAAAELSVLRKLTLEDVSKEAIRRQQVVGDRRLTKAERDAKLAEQRAADKEKAKNKPGMQKQQQIKKKEGLVLLPDTITLKELAEKTGIQVPVLLGALMKSGVMVTINQSIDYDTAAIVVSELGVQVAKEQRAASAEHLHSRNLAELLKDEPENLVARPPIVVIMGHVDHGKTSLLDAIRKTDVAGGEAGGITQHIGAYQVEHEISGSKEHRKITFLDTPGHEAFAAMRARGAQVTDVVILVVAADEGVKPTTLEALNHVKEANVPMVVAITKIDRERADLDRVKAELASHGVQPEEWGGTVPFIPCSAVTKAGISDLLDHVLLIAETKGVKANPNRSAIATVIESHLDTAHGPLATVIVNTGTLRVGDVFVCGELIGRVKALIDAAEHRLKEVQPSGAAQVSGMDSVPSVGEILQVMPSEREARTVVEAVGLKAGAERKHQFADLVSRLTEGKLKQLKVVLKADAQGSLEAITAALQQLTAKDGGVTVKVIHGAIGAVKETDVMMAAASDGIVIAFHADIPPEVRRTADRETVQIREYRILYELLDEVSALLLGLVEPEEAETILGHLEVRGVFLTKKSEQIVGGKVTDGVIKRVPFRHMRDGAQVGTGRITSLKHVDKDIKEAKEGSECGMRVETSVPVLEGDIFEAYIREWKKREA